MRDDLQGILWSLGIIWMCLVGLGYFQILKGYRKVLADYKRAEAMLENVLEQLTAAKAEAAENKRLLAEVRKCNQLP